MQTIRLLCALCVLASISAVATPAQSEIFRVGRLLCWSSPRIGFVVGSTQSLRCVFYRRGSSQRYIYAGRIRRVGLDVGVTGRGVLSWAVFAKNSRIGPGTMRGSYVGASANVALGPGFGANALVGGSHNSVALQPLSVQGQVGLNVQAGLEGLELRPAR